MATAPPLAPSSDASARLERGPKLRWWRELAYIVVFYLVYSWVRNQFGSESVGADTAFANARRVIDVERALGTFHEESVQDAFLDDRWFISLWNIYYGTFHFVVTPVCLGLLFWRWPRRYVRWRTTLAVTTALALIGYAAFPLMPPRLLPASYGFVDTLRDYQGLWSFDDEELKAVSNQYAAMPSLHFGWSTWCALVLVPQLRSTWAKVVAWLYPVTMLFAIVVTANHFWLDAAGGALVLAGGIAVGRWWDRRVHR